MSALPETRDLGKIRGFTPRVVEMFRVETQSDRWVYSLSLFGGGVGQRAKSYYSIAPPGADKWSKYAWVPTKPDGALYLYPPGHSLTEAIKAADGLLYMSGGDMGTMSLMSAGLMHATNTFGDTAIPASLADDLKRLGVKRLVLLPDRDTSGQRWACKIRDLLIPVGLDIELDVKALPFPMSENHGRDVNDWWLDILEATPTDGDPGATLREQLTQLKDWLLPEPERKGEQVTDAVLAPIELPADFIGAVERALDVEPRFNGTGWTRKPVRCPFHDDAHPSAFWNRHMAILRCFSGCGKTYLAKETGEKLGLNLRDYLSATPRIPVAKTAGGTTITLTPKTEPAPVEAPPVPVPAQAAAPQLRPPLPAYAALSDVDLKTAAAGRGWLDDYVRWATKAAPASPAIFHEAMGAWMLATVATRRIRIMFGGDEIYPNLYVLIVAKTSLYRKTTAMNQCRRLLHAAGLDALLVPEDNTPEALFDELSGVKPANFDGMSRTQQDDWLRGRSVAAQRSFMVDEASSIFASFRKDYMAGLSELLLKGYDPNISGMRKNLKSRGLVVLKDLSLSFLGATTPVMMAKHMTNEETENGFLARFAIITPDSPPVYSESTDPVGVPQALIDSVRRMFLDVLPWHSGQKPGGSAMMSEVVSPPVADVQLDPTARRRLSDYRRAVGHDLILAGKVIDKEAPYSRLPTMAIKLAMLLAMTQTEPGRPIYTTEANALAGILIAERWRESLHRLDRDTSQATASRHDQRLLDYLREAGPGGATMRELRRDCGLRDQRQAVETLSMLADAGLVEMYERKPAGAGRPARCYRLVTGGAS